MMMSNTPSSLQQRQRLHRRQNSTPVAFEAMKVPMPHTIQRQQAHRRGQSFDMSRSPIRRQHTGGMVSIDTNTGTFQGQQILREAQQQRIARPGQHPSHIGLPISAQCNYFEQSSSLPGSPYDMTMNAVMSGSQDMMAHSQYPGMQVQMSEEQPMMFEFDENYPSQFQAVHQMYPNLQMIPETDRRMSHPELRIHTGMRPFTPNQQIQTAHFPLTPASTPFRVQQIQYARSMQGSPKSSEILSPRPLSMQKSQSLQGIAEHDEFKHIPDLSGPSTQQESTPTEEPIKRGRPLHSKSSSMSAITHHSKALFGEVTDEDQKLDHQPAPILTSSNGSESPSRPALSPRRMSISDLNLDPGINASIEETNVTLDDIAQFIEGPDPEDNKWVCKYEDCDKRFGRKENIKSHVQTHLGDRQFRCDHCKKCFVRGHDLKRHAKIHTGTKAYTCLCGNAFARHDALTRHRQRGMCIGAFEGIVRKEIKRGRPRKHRPDMGDRVDKATRSRRPGTKNTDNDTYASSASSCSISSYGSPPTDSMDNLSIHGDDHSPYDDGMNLFGMVPQTMDMPMHATITTIDQVALPPGMFSFTPPASPGYSTGNRPSPYYRELTPTELVNIEIAIAQSPHRSPVRSPVRSSLQTFTGTNDMSYNNEMNRMPTMIIDPSITSFSNDSLACGSTNMVLQHSQQSLPSLSHSSSPPPMDAVAFDFNDDSMTNFRISTISNLSFSNFKPETDSSRNEFDSFLDFGGMDNSGIGFDTSNTDSFFANS